MRALTYLIYIIFWESLVLGGSIYLYGWRGWSGWWVALGFLLSTMAYSPKKWGQLFKEDYETGKYNESNG